MARRHRECGNGALAEAVGGQDCPMDEAGVLRVIARTGKPGNRLRAVELIGKHLGMFRDEGAQ